MRSGEQLRDIFAAAYDIHHPRRNTFLSSIEQPVLTFGNRRSKSRIIDSRLQSIYLNSQGPPMYHSLTALKGSFQITILRECSYEDVVKWCFPPIMECDRRRNERDATKTHYRVNELLLMIGFSKKNGHRRLPWDTFVLKQGCTLIYDMRMVLNIDICHGNGKYYALIPVALQPCDHVSEAKKAALSRSFF